MVITWRDTQNTLVLDCSGRELREHVLRASALLRGLATATCCRYAGGRFQIESLCSLGIDESQVDAILAKHEVDTVYPETLSFTQQIQ